MNTTLKIAILILFSLFAVTAYNQETLCKIKGTIIDRDTKGILITPITEEPDNIVFLSKGILIPVENNKFEYDLKVPFIESYMLIFKEEVERQGWCIREFFPDTTVVEITIFPDDQSSKNIIKGGRLNNAKIKTEYLYNSQSEAINNALDSLSKIKKYLDPEYENLTNRIYQTQDTKEREKLRQERALLEKRNKIYTSEGLAMVSKRDSIIKAHNKKKNNYIKTNKNLYSYSLLFNKAKYSTGSNELSLISEVYPIFAQEYPLHPYTKKLEEILSAHTNLKIGGHYIDFTAPTIEGKSVTISNEINGKIALIDLWSTWCSPCRVAGKSMIPLYEKYKDKGFTVIGIAGVKANLQNYEVALEKDKYPWLNLIELNSQNSIWNKYGIANAGGCIILVDSTGKILAINPKAEEVEKILIDLLD